MAAPRSLSLGGEQERDLLETSQSNKEVIKACQGKVEEVVQRAAAQHKAPGLERLAVQGSKDQKNGQDLLGRVAPTPISEIIRLIRLPMPS